MQYPKSCTGEYPAQCPWRHNRWHSCAETKRRNTFLERAEKDAEDAIGFHFGPETTKEERNLHGTPFTRVFSGLMDRYCRANRGDYNEETFKK